MIKKLIFLMSITLAVSPAIILGCENDVEETSNERDQVRLATPAEWTEREDGLQAFEEHYNVQWPENDLVIIELGLGYEAVATGEAEAGTGDATEGRLEKFDLRILEDDQDFFPAYNPAPVVRNEILAEYPDLEEHMKELSSKLTLDTLTELNKRVSVDGEQPENVAKDFLVKEDLIDPEEEAEVDPDKDTPIVVSSKTFSEALTLGNMTVYLLEERGYDVVDETGLGEVAMIRPALESGQIDLYWEYTGTGLFNVMDHDEVISDPEECYQTIKEWDEEHNDIIWLDYAPANNSFVIFISDEVYEEYGWETISDMTEHVSEAE